MSGVFQASMVEEDFRQMWSIDSDRGGRNDRQHDRSRPSRRLVSGTRPCPGGSALSSMLEHSCYVWFHQGGDEMSTEGQVERAVDTLASMWYHAIYWEPE